MYDIGDDELAAVKRVLTSKRFYRYNSNSDTECDLFEKEFSNSFSISYSLLLSSGTNSLLVALIALKIQPGDEVIVPAYTFFATINAVLLAGAVPIIVNNNSELGLDVAELKTKITDKTKAIIVVHMDGLVSNVLELKEFCAQSGLFLIEDVAQALGGHTRNQKLGTIGDAGCFSLNENKVLSCGEGGIFITNSREFYERAFCAHDTPSQFSPSRKDLFQTIVPFVGHSMRISEIQGAIMRAQLSKLTDIRARLRERKEIWLRTLASADIIKGFDEVGECHTSILMRMNDVFQCGGFLKKLILNRIQAQSIIARPAHVAWKWHHLVNQVHPQCSYTAGHFAASIELLSRIIKFDININLSLSETEAQARLIKSLLT